MHLNSFFPLLPFNGNDSYAPVLKRRLFVSGFVVKSQLQVMVIQITSL